MNKPTPTLLLTTSPFLKDRVDTAWIMWQVNVSLVPVVLVAFYFFGVSALLVIAAAAAGAVLPEWALGRARGRTTIRDGSAVITGVLLGLTLPPGLPLWMAFVGGAVAIGIGKLAFGGIGQSIFNPALVGRAFLLAAFPVAMTTWTLPAGTSGWFDLAPGTLAWPFLRPSVDAVSAATPLAQMKFEAHVTGWRELLVGSTAGSLGETSAVVILLSGVYLAARRVLNWRIPVSILATVLVVSAALHVADPAAYASPSFHLFAGGLVLGAVFMATDPVTSPITQRGCWLFGTGIGVLVVVIRTYGGLPEGVMYAILLMNAVTPLINRVTQPRVFGVQRA